MSPVKNIAHQLKWTKKMKSKCFSDEDLMKFADGELNNKELSMDIIHKVLQDGDEADDVRKRLNVFTKTRSALINSLIGNINDSKQ